MKPRQNITKLQISKTNDKVKEKLKPHAPIKHDQQE
jgi:hypothetical protein